MAKGDNDCDNNNSHSEKSIDPNNSFVKKVTSRVSGFIPSTFSKWFSGNERTTASVRLRDEEEEDDPFMVQPPPSKRARIPLNVDYPPNSFIVDPSLANCKQKFALPVSEPVAGPSGIRTQKLFSSTLGDLQSTYPIIHSEHLNGDNKSDSGESTSGYSSMPRLSRKEQHPSLPSTSAHNATLSHLGSRSLFNSSVGVHSRSLFSERSLSPQVNSSLSSRRPSFNASTFGSPGFVDRTLTTKRIVNSPFYSGRTMYGGASAYGKRLKLSPNDSVTAKNSFQMKPINESSLSTNESVVLSKTARRILDTLEQFSSPILDAKKIPNVSRKQQIRQEGANKPYSRDQGRSSTANVELQVPTIPELLRLKQKEKLQDSTVVVRQIATTSKSALNAEEYKIRTDDDRESSKQSSKMKTKLTLGHNRKCKESQEETLTTFTLPEVVLPISTLPKFDFTLPPPSTFASTSKPTTVVKEATKPQMDTTKTTKTPEKIMFKSPTTKLATPSTSSAVSFKFANPLIVTDAEMPTHSTNSYKFSEPIVVNDTVSVISSKPAEQMPLFTFKSPDTISPLKKTVKNNGQSSSIEVVKPAAQLLTGSVMDILGKSKPPTKTEDNLMDKFKPAAGTWECTSCMIRNLPYDTVCAACQTKKEEKEKPAPKTDGFGSAFKVTSNKWECSTCMVRNNNTDEKCVACTMPKPSNAPATNNLPIMNTFGDKFKAPSDTWECVACMIRNKSDVQKCVACETAKPGSNPIKKPATFNTTGLSAPIKSSGGWECSSCLVRNDESKTKCACCETPKPGSAPSKQISTQSSLPINVNPKEWECISCLIRNDPNKSRCACCDAPKPGSVGMKECKFGIPTNSPPKFSFGFAKQSQNVPFSFGIPSGVETAIPKPSDIFGSNASTNTTTTSASFGFGIKSNPTVSTPVSTIETKTVSSTSVDFAFGVPSKNVLETKDVTDSNKKKENPLLNPPKPDITVPQSLSANKASVSSTETKPTTNMFAFGASKPAVVSTATGSSGTVSSTSASTVSNMFAFGAKPSASEPQKNEPIKTPAPVFSFGSNSSPASTGLTASKPFVFGNPADSNKNSSSVVSSTNSLTTASTTFGAPGIGLNSFSAIGNSKPDSSKLFAFGAAPSNPGPAPTTAGVSFSAPSGGFNFKAGNSTFGNSPNLMASQNPTPNFPPALTSPPTNGGFNMNPVGQVDNTPKPAFNFGSNPQLASNMFSFGTPNQNSQPTPGGFSFGANISTSAPPNMFVPNAKPNTHFTMGAQPHAFTAQAQPSDAAPQRRFRKAIRRTPR